MSEPIMVIMVDEEDFKVLCAATTLLQSKGMEIQTAVKRAELEIAHAKLRLHEANLEMRTTLVSLAQKYSFDPEALYDLDYQAKALVPKK